MAWSATTYCWGRVLCVVDENSWQGWQNKKLVAPTPIPDKASHPNFPHSLSIEYAEHVDQHGYAANPGKNRKMKPRKRKMWNMQTVSAREKGQSGEWGRVALSRMALGDMDKREQQNFHCREMLQNASWLCTAIPAVLWCFKDCNRNSH